LGGGALSDLDSSPFICESVNPGRFLPAGAADVLLGGVAPGNPPGSFMPRLSAMEGFEPPMRRLGTAGAD
jgi:hypothetical protein